MDLELHPGKRPLEQCDMELESPTGQSTPAETSCKRAKLVSAAAAVEDVSMNEGPAAVSNRDISMGEDADAYASLPRYRDELTVFVKGLRMGLLDADLQGLFQGCGGLKEVRPVRLKDGKFRGFAYVEFTSEQGVREALELNGKEFQGKTLAVALSSPPGSSRVNGKGQGEGADLKGAVQGGGKARGEKGKFMPPSVGQKAPAVTTRPMSNEEFRKMLRAQTLSSKRQGPAS